MAIAKKCLACDHYRNTCVGKSNPCPDWTAINLTPESKVEVTIVPKASIPEPEPKVETTPKDGESPSQKFDRIGQKRQAQALEAIRKLGHLTSHYRRKRTGITAYTYEWTEEMALELVRPIEEALEALKDELLGCDSPREHGLIEEK